MSDPTRTELVEERIKRANLWLRRARLDYQGLRHLMPKGKQSNLLPSDPALAVQLLQQCVEKAVKALFVASGEDEEQMRKDYGHASFSLYLAYMTKFADTPATRNMMDEFFKIPGFSKTPLPDLIVTVHELEQKSGFKHRDETFWNEWAACPANVVSEVCDRFAGLRDNITQQVNQTLRAKDLKIDLGDILLGTDQAKLSNTTTVILGNPLSEHQLKALAGVLAQMKDLFGTEFVNQASQMQGIALDRSFRTQLRNGVRNHFYTIWAELSLLILAALTFPHAVTARYPSPSSGSQDPVLAAKEGTLGSDLYAPPLGIVESLPSVVRLTGLTIDSLGPAIQAAAGFALLTGDRR